MSEEDRLMPETAVSDDALKQVLKDAVVEALQEHRDLFHEIFSEVLEDFALVAAIREGQKTKKIDRSEVFEVLHKQKKS